ncbi:MAG: flagellar export chaperone FliS [Bacillota bacterium]|jgi:flagellar protein FliS
MSYANAYAKYKDLSVKTLTPGELIVLLYDEMALQINRAILNIKKNKLEDVHHNLIKAQNIVLYLVDILDINYPISDNLLRLYEFIYFQMVKANGEKNVVFLEDVLHITNQLKDTWRQAESIHRQKMSLEGNIV